MPESRTPERRPRALITRPQEDAAGIAVALARRRITPVLAPMMMVHYARTEIDGDLGRAQAVLFTSRNGVRAFCRSTGRRDLRVFAVGNSTAALARENGFSSIESAGGDTDDLARLVLARLHPGDGALLHASGAAVAGDLANRLEKAGFEVIRRVLYEARPIESLPASTVEAMRDDDIDIVLFFSPRTAANFVRLVADAGLAEKCASLLAVCLSPAVADALAPVAWRRIGVAEAPTMEALLAALDAAMAAPDRDEPPDDEPPDDEPQESAGTDRQIGVEPAGESDEKRGGTERADRTEPAAGAAAGAGGSATEPQGVPQGAPDGAPDGAPQGAPEDAAEDAGLDAPVDAAPEAREDESDDREMPAPVPPPAASPARSSVPVTADTPPRREPDRQAPTEADAEGAAPDASASEATSTGSTSTGSAAAGSPKAGEPPSGPSADEAAETASAPADADDDEREAPPLPPPPATSPATPPARRRGAGRAVLVTLVVVAVLIAAAWFTLPMWRAQLPESVRAHLSGNDAAEIAQLRRDASAATEALAAARARIGALEKRAAAAEEQVEPLRGRVAELEQSLDATTERLVAADEKAAEADALRSRLAALENEAAELRQTAEQSGALAAQIARLSDRLRDAETALADSNRRVVELEQEKAAALSSLEDAQQAAESVARVESLTVAAMRLRTALDGSDGFAPALESFRARTAGNEAAAAAVAPLDAFAESGAPTREALLRRLPDVVTAAAEAARETKPEGWVDRAVGKIRAFVSIRRIDGKGDGVDSILVRAEKAAAEGDLATVHSELGRLEGRAAGAVEGWRADAAARLAADEAAAELARLVTSGGNGGSGGGGGTR